MKPLVLLLLASCASAHIGDVKQAGLVPFTDGWTLVLTPTHQTIWERGTVEGLQRAQGIATPKLGETVTVRSALGDYRGIVTQTQADGAFLLLDGPSYRGMSGSGAFREDGTIIGTVQTRNVKDYFLVRISNPPERR